jgi:hypothetical protein
MKLALQNHPFSDWFFPLVSIRSIRLLRIALAAVTLGCALVWLPHVHAFFTDEGFVPASFVYENSYYSKLSIFFINDEVWFVQFCYALLLISALGMALGRGGRASAILTYILFISFASRFPLVFYGAIDALHSFLFFNILHPSAAYAPWSRGGIKERNQLVPAWSVRMIQLTLCLIYFFAGAQKIRVNTWWDGTEILNTLNTRFGAFDFYWLVKYSLIINLMSYGTLLVEIAFPFLIYNKAAHRFILTAIAGMHVGIGLIMNASLFSPVMLAALVCFITVEDEKRIAELWHKYTQWLAPSILRVRALVGVPVKR